MDNCQKIHESAKVPKRWKGESCRIDDEKKVYIIVQCCDIED